MGQPALWWRCQHCMLLPVYEVLRLEAAQYACPASQVAWHEIFGQPDSLAASRPRTQLGDGHARCKCHDVDLQDLQEDDLQGVLLSVDKFAMQLNTDCNYLDIPAQEFLVSLSSQWPPALQLGVAPCQALA